VATGEVKPSIQRNIVAWSLNDDGKWLITSDNEKVVRIWDVEKGKELRAFAGHKKPVTQCSISSDKKLLAAYEESGTARLWDAARGKELRTMPVHPSAGSAGSAGSCPFQPGRRNLGDLEPSAPQLVGFGKRQ